MNISKARRQGLPVSGAQPSQALSSELRQRLASLASSAADQVSLSSFSAALQSAGAGTAQQSAGLEEIRAAVANQSYRIDFPAVSASIVTQHLRA
jgi:anti-sigma28 factor (negative regulator of flagellin synthesis)